MLRFLVTAQAAALAKEHPEWVARDEKEVTAPPAVASSKKRRLQAGAGTYREDSVADMQSDAVRRGLLFLANLDADEVFLDRVRNVS